MSAYYNTMMESALYMKIILAFGILGLLSFLVLEISFLVMVRDSANMPQGRKRWINILKNRYENCHVMHVRINHVEAFVERFLIKKRILGLKVSAWVTMFSLSAWACAITGAAAALLLSQTGQDLHAVMTAYLTGITASGGLFFLGTFLRLGEKTDLIRTNIYDYLENVLANRLEGRIPEESVSDQSAADSRSGKAMDIDGSRESADAARKQESAKTGRERVSARTGQAQESAGIRQEAESVKAGRERVSVRTGQARKSAGIRQEAESVKAARKQESAGTGRERDSARKDRQPAGFAGQTDIHPETASYSDIGQMEASAASYSRMSAREKDVHRADNTGSNRSSKDNFQSVPAAVTAEEEKLLEDIFEDYLY